MNVFKKIAAPGQYQDAYAIPALVDYIMNPAKRKCYNVFGGFHVSPNDIAESMISVSQRFNKDSGVRLHHFIVTLDPGDDYVPAMLREMAELICSRYSGEYQIIYALHENTEYLHFHFMFNAISFTDGHRFRCDYSAYYRMFNWVQAAVSVFSEYTTIHVKHKPALQDPDE